MILCLRSEAASPSGRLRTCLLKAATGPFVWWPLKSSVRVLAHVTGLRWSSACLWRCWWAEKAGKSSADGRVMSRAGAEQPDQIVAVASKSGRVDSLASGIGYIRSNPYFSRLGRIQVSTGTLLLQQRSTRLFFIQLLGPVSGKKGDRVAASLMFWTT